jgi:type I restriction enzyme S subunit
MTMNPDWLLKHFEQISEAPDAVPRLRRFILDLAVRGKLVEQDPEDEPATEMLKRVAAEKRRLAEEGQIRKQKPLPLIREDEVPFNVHKNWKLVRLGEVSTLITKGSTPTSYGHSFVQHGINFVKVEAIKAGLLLPENITSHINSETHEFLKRSQLKSGDFLFSIAGSIGTCAVVTEQILPANTNQALAIIRGANLAFSLGYLSYSSSSDLLGFTVAKARGGAMNNISLEDVSNFILPLPPLAEQHRIVAKVDELMALCDELEEVQAKREKRRDRLVAATLHGLNNGDANPETATTSTFEKSARFYFNHLPRLTARPEHIHQLRQTILNLAIRGKLVPQDPQDEPASELLKCIRAEKERLMKEGKARRQEPQPELEANGMPFAIPNSWSWARLGDVIHLVSGQHLQPGEYSDQKQNGPPYITGPADFGVDGLVITRYAIVRKAVATNGQILLTVKGAGVGKTAVCNLEEVAISRQLMAMTAIKWSQSFLLLTAHRLAESLKETARSLIPGISREDVDRFVFPLPPLAEQHRIVGKVDELMALCDELEARLTTTATARRQLLEATLHEALMKRSLHEVSYEN